MVIFSLISIAFSLDLHTISISQTRVAEVPDFGGYPTKNGSQGLPLPLTRCGFIFGFRCTDYYHIIRSERSGEAKRLFISNDGVLSIISSLFL